MYFAVRIIIDLLCSLWLQSSCKIGSFVLVGIKKLYIGRYYAWILLRLEAGESIMKEIDDTFSYGLK